MMKISAQVHTYNSEEYIWYAIKSIVDYVDKIVVIDGAWNKRVGKPKSTDDTINIVKKLQLKYDKIILSREHSVSEHEQRTKVFKHITPENTDWLFIVDDDEIYDERSMKKLRLFCERASQDSYLIRSINFVNSFKWYYNTTQRRLFRMKPNMKFTAPLSIVHGKDKKLYKPELIVPEVVKYHYSYVRDISRIKIKKNMISHPFAWRIINGYYYRKGMSLKLFKGKHPAIIKMHPYRKNKYNFKKHKLFIKEIT